MPSDLVTLKDGKPVTTSLIVAEAFDKNHRDVLRNIDTIINTDAYQKRGLRNFAQTPYIHPQNSQTHRMFEMDRQGFEILAMGFTGEKALDWKLKYSDAFAAMEAALTQPATGFTLPKTKAEALFLAAEQARIIEEQDAKLAEQEPKVLLYDQLADSDGLTRFPNLLGMLKGKTGQSYHMADLKLFLRKAGFLCWQKELEPTVKAIDAGWFAVRYEERKFDGETHMVPEWAVTPKGFLAIWNVVVQPQRRYGQFQVQTQLLTAAQTANREMQP
jgi:Rha family phage regulatory protein